jgi:hypothetical protein
MWSLARQKWPDARVSASECAPTARRNFIIADFDRREDVPVVSLPLVLQNVTKWLLTGRRPRSPWAATD